MSKVNKIGLFFIFLAAIFIIGYILFYQHPARENKVIPVILNGHELRVEVVSSSDELEKGLGERADICANCGMLFEFQVPGKYSFWMKGMQFPLDIVWIYQKKIVHIEKNIPFSYNGTLMPEENADMVLEVNAGMLDKLQTKIGDMVTI